MANQRFRAWVLRRSINSLNVNPAAFMWFLRLSLLTLMLIAIGKGEATFGAMFLAAFVGVAYALAAASFAAYLLLRNSPGLQRVKLEKQADPHQLEAIPGLALLAVEMACITYLQWLPLIWCYALGTVSLFLFPAIYATHQKRLQKKLRVFLCGPMTGIPEYNYPAFHATAKRLRTAGLHVENPAENPVQHTLNGSAFTWSDCMRESIPQLCTCEAIYLLPGWSKSKGAQAERDIAVTLGMKLMGAVEG